MLLLSPLWLIALIPWLAIALWLLRGARESSQVPFLPLWHGTQAHPQTHRRMKLPHSAVLFALLAALLGLVAAARPSIKHDRALHHPIVVILDRGLTMSAHGSTGPLFVEVAAQVAQALRDRFSDGDIHLITVPASPPQSITIASLATEAASLPPTACDTRQALADVIASQSPGPNPIIVITNQTLATHSQNLIQVCPTAKVQDVGITKFAVRDAPTTQAMVVLRNQSEKRKVVLRVSSGAQLIQNEIELPVAPNEKTCFFDLPQVHDLVEARLVDPDDNPANDRAWAVRESAQPRIEPRSALPSAIGRMIESYSNARPATGSSSVIIADDVQLLPAGQPGVVVVTSREPQSGQIAATDHAITRIVHWENVPRITRSSTAAPEGWTPVLRAGSEALVAVKEDQPRRVWVGFTADGWESTTDFVIFWTNVFDWVGASEASGFASHALSEWTPQWKLEGGRAGEWPGIYVRADGARRAFNPPDATANAVADEKWRQAISRLTAKSGGTELTQSLLLAALACLLAAAIKWRS